MASAAAAGLGEAALGYVVPGYIVEVFPSCWIEGWRKLIARRKKGASHMIDSGCMDQCDGRMQRWSNNQSINNERFKITATAVYQVFAPNHSMNKQSFVFTRLCLYKVLYNSSQDVMGTPSLIQNAPSRPITYLPHQRAARAIDWCPSSGSGLKTCTPHL